MLTLEKLEKMIHAVFPLNKGQSALPKSLYCRIRGVNTLCELPPDSALALFCYFAIEKWSKDEVSKFVGITYEEVFHALHRHEMINVHTRYNHLYRRRMGLIRNGLHELGIHEKVQSKTTE
jgi:hypothetical protein